MANVNPVVYQQGSIQNHRSQGEDTLDPFRSEEDCQSSSLYVQHHVWLYAIFLLGAVTATVLIQQGPNQLFHSHIVELSGYTLKNATKRWSMTLFSVTRLSTRKKIESAAS